MAEQKCTKADPDTPSGFICYKMNGHDGACCKGGSSSTAVFRNKTAMRVAASLSMGFKDLPPEQIAKAACEIAEALMNEACGRGWNT